jgi:excisionase family DNA binding protein
MLTVRQAAERAGVSQALVYDWVGSGELAHYRLGREGRRGAIRIAQADLDAFLATRRVGAAPQPAPPNPSPQPRQTRPSVNYEHLRLPAV